MSLKLFLGALPLLLITGCGGSDGDSSSNEPSIPLGTVRFNDAFADYNGGVDDLDGSASAATINGASFNVQVPGGSRTLAIDLPNASVRSGARIAFEGTSGAVAGFLSTVTSPGVRAASWTATSGSVTVVSRNGLVATLRLNNLSFTADEASGALGRFTLNGTILTLPTPN
ncbi:hypothetical protein EON77_00570 [bacterium]|nr:MAG: hypothetical protein EON77_00570 [bacterium]